MEARKREEDAKQKQIEFQRSTEEKLLEQQRRVMAKKAEMDARDRER